MNERDIPSVPITTLAGVASLTDCKYYDPIKVICISPMILAVYTS